MTWADEHGVVHLVHQLPEEIWSKLNEASKTRFAGLPVMTDERLKSGEVVIIQGPTIPALPDRDYPRYQTYCGEAREAPGFRLDTPTCIECVKIDALINTLAERGIPWWR